MKKRPTVDQAFGSVLREYRKQSDRTQEGLALDAGLARNYISLLERGLRQPSLASILAIAKTLGVPAAELVAAVESAMNSK